MALLIPASDTFLVDLFLLLACAIAGGEIASRLGLVSLVGQSIVGVILGPTLLGPYIGLGSTTLSPEIAGIQFLATFFILFMAGLTIDPDAILRMSSKTAMVGLAIFAVPFGLGAWVVALVEPGLPLTTDLFIALTLSITAIPVLGIMVAEFGLAGKPLGKLVMGAAVVNELIGVTIFAVLLQVTLSGHTGAYAVSSSILAVVLFLAVVLIASWAVTAIRATAWWRAKPDRLGHLWRSREAGFAILMAIGLGAALYSQLLGLTFLVGAFYAGLLISQAYVGRPGPPTFVSTFTADGRLISQPTPGTEPYRAFVSIFSTMNWMFFIPLFFVLVGVEMNLRDLGGVATLGAFVVLLLMAVATKLGTGAALTRAMGLSGPDSVAAGFLLSCRGAIGLALAVLLRVDGIFTPAQFTIVALVGLVTTIVSPVGALWAWRSTSSSRAELEARMPALRQGRPLRLGATIEGPPAPPAAPAETSPPSRPREP